MFFYLSLLVVVIFAVENCVDHDPTTNGECYCDFKTDGTVYGDYFFQGSSDVCTAATFLGLTPGIVTIEISDAFAYYTTDGQTNNGITPEPIDYAHSYGHMTYYFLEAEIGNCPIRGWSAGSQDKSGPITCWCDVEVDSSGIWGGGDGVYTIDSYPCHAATHAGLTPGYLTFDLMDGRSSYSASTANGITTSPWGSYGGSYVISSSDYEPEGGDIDVPYCTTENDPSDGECYCDYKTSGTIYGDYWFEGTSDVCTAATFLGLTPGVVNVATTVGWAFYTVNGEMADGTTPTNGIIPKWKNYDFQGHNTFYFLDVPTGYCPIKGWSAGDQDRVDGVVCYCDTEVSSDGVWGGGDGVYTIDSYPCHAATHAELTPGYFKFDFMDGRSSYSSSTANGITSYSWGSYGGSYVISYADDYIPDDGANNPEPEATVDYCPERGWAAGFQDQTESFSCYCDEEVDANGVWGGGDGFYTIDSYPCHTATHAGQTPGVVTFNFVDGRNAYLASTANGISSASWGSYGGSYYVTGEYESDVNPDYCEPRGWTAGFQDQTESVTCYCDVEVDSHGVWGGGDGVYTIDSYPCHAATHAGQVPGYVTFNFMDGQSSYSASTANGVTSDPWGSYGGSYTITGEYQDEEEPMEPFEPTSGEEEPVGEIQYEFSCEETFPEYATATWNENCYVLLTEPVYYDEGEEFCESLGGHLASVHSEEENTMIYNFAANHWTNSALHSVWIGGRDNEAEGIFLWEDGSAWDYTRWNTLYNEPNGGANENYVHMFITLFGGKVWNDLGAGMSGYVNQVGAVCKVPFCQNYQGDYIAGFQQCGFDDTHFQGDYEHIDSIDEILENLENQFIDQADYELGLLDAAFSTKEAAHSNAVSSESAYQTAMEARIAAESAYNSARVTEENSHSVLLSAMESLNTAVRAYDAQYSTYKEQMDFLNYELYIIHEIRELLGDSLDYVPVQTVLEVNEHDNAYADFATAFPTLFSSSFANHRFGSVSDEDREHLRKGKRPQKKAKKNKRRLPKKKARKSKKRPQKKRATKNKRPQKKRMTKNKRPQLKKRMTPKRRNRH